MIAAAEREDDLWGFHDPARLDVAERKLVKELARATFDARTRATDPGAVVYTPLRRVPRGREREKRLAAWREKAGQMCKKKVKFIPVLVDYVQTPNDVVTTTQNFESYNAPNDAVNIDKNCFIPLETMCHYRQFYIQRYERRVIVNNVTPGMHHTLRTMCRVYYFRDMDRKLNLMSNASGGNTGYLEELGRHCLLYTSPSPRDKRQSRMPSSA